MLRSFSARLSFVAVLLAFALSSAAQAQTRIGIPPPQTDDSLAPKSGKQTAIFAGGCFWGTQSVFEHLKGVEATSAGFSVGPDDTPPGKKPNYAESVRVVYNPSKITYGQLVRPRRRRKIPTKRNRIQ